MADAQDQLVAALMGRQREIAASNPWINAGSMLQSQSVIDPKADFQKNLIAGALQGLGGGFMQGMGQRQVQDEVSGLGAQMAQALSGQDPAAAFQANPQLQQFAPYVQLDQAQRQRENSDVWNKAMAQAFASNPMGFRRAFGGAQNAPQTQPSETKDPYNLGLGPSINEEYQRMLAEEQAMGTPGAQASEAVLTRLKGRFTDEKAGLNKVQQARDTANKLMNLADSAQAGAEMAGTTGIPVLTQANRLYANIAGKPEAQGYALLDKILPELIAYGRPPGAFTEQEWEFLRRSGPSTSNNKESNLLLAGMIRQGGQLQSDYADFTDYVLSNGGTLAKANELWSKYRNSFSLLSKTQNGNVTVNTERQPWQQFFAGKGKASTEGGLTVTRPPSVTDAPKQQQQIPPGMKLQRNRVTGETRLVPQ